jgi:glycopeptide antibiotics resistance protein
MSIAEYFEWYILYIPHSVYVWGLVAFLLVLVVAVLISGRKNGIRYGAGFLLAEYVALQLHFTVFIRRELEGSRCILTPFWSYKAINNGVDVLMQEIAMNVAVMIPVGFLMGVCLKRATWWKVALAGGGISLMVEILQLLLRRGFCETDDVIHNTLGSLAGYGMFVLIKYATKKLFV